MNSELMSFESPALFQIPLALSEWIHRRSGLVLLGGDRHSGVERLLVEVTREQWERGRRPGAFVLRSEPESFHLASPYLLVRYEEYLQPLVQKALNEKQVFIFQGLRRVEELEWGLELAEEGHMVIQHFYASSLASILHRVFGSWLQSLSGSHHLWRWAQQLQGMLVPVPVFGGPAAQEPDRAFEIALLSSDSKKLLAQENIEEFLKKLEASEDKSGFVSLNQSLLQLLIRRKIDVKRAFETSQDPEAFDRLLKKVGI